MTDFQTKDFSDPLTPINPSKNTSNTLEVNTSDNFNEANPGKTLIKKPSSIWVVFLCSIFLIITGLFSTVLLIIEGMRNGDIPVYINFVLFSLFLGGYTLGCLATISTKIHIDNSAGIITITKRKTFYCFNVSVKIQIKEIEQAFIKERVYDDSDNIYKIFFKLLNGNEILVCMYESLNETNKYFNIFKSELSDYIIFNDNIVHEYS